MPTSGDHPRYPKRQIERQPDMMVRGQNLGPALKPQDIFIWLRIILALEPDEIIGAFRTVLDTDCNSFPDLTHAEIDAMLIACAEVTPSRIEAWRRRHREMTWLELRALLLGLRDTK